MAAAATGGRTLAAIAVTGLAAVRTWSQGAIAIADTLLGGIEQASRPGAALT